MKHTILFVDDEPFVVNALSRVFKREGYETLTATSGKEALEKMEQTPVNLIVADQRMPGMTGVELLKTVKERYPVTVRIILSGYSDINEIIAAINVGEVYRFVTKPWDDKEFIELIKRAIEQYEIVETFSAIFGNATRTADFGRKINFETTQSGNSIRITVKDSGRPLLSEDIARILGFLFSALGFNEEVAAKLRFASGVIEKQKGRLTLTTETDKGITLTIELPVKE